MIKAINLKARETQIAEIQQIVYKFRIPQWLAELIE